MVRKNPEYEKELQQLEKDYDLIGNQLDEIAKKEYITSSKIDMLINNNYKLVNVSRIVELCTQLNDYRSKYNLVEKEYKKLGKRLLPIG